MFRKAAVATALTCLGVFAVSGASAESLREALAAAYRFNPDIAAERANLRATDEEVPRAYSAARPTVSASADIGARRTRTRPGRTDRAVPRGYEVELRQNVFRGFRTRNAVKSAEATIRSGRATLHRTEQTVLQQAVAAYMDVLRDEALIKLRQNNVKVLAKNLTAAEERLRVGDVTATDVAQSRARWARAVSELELARANLEVSRAAYERIVGHHPRRLATPKIPAAQMPRTLTMLRTRATNEAPTVIEALYQEEAARHNVALVWGELLPSVDLDARFTKRFEPSSGVRSTATSELIGRLTVPIYLGGEVRARLRQAKHLLVRRIQLIAAARREAQETAVSTWSAWQASNAQLRSDFAQVEANKIALAGVRAEERVGSRTLLDVLDAEQELLDARVLLVRTRRDVVTNAYAVLGASGRLTAKELGLSRKLYDPEVHYREVRRKWFGISITHQDGRREHLTVRDKRAYK